MEPKDETVVFGEKCRVCLCESEEMHDLFTDLDNGVTLRDILTTTTSIPIKDERDPLLSNYVCLKCTNIVLEFHNLKTVFQQNEEQQLLGEKFKWKCDHNKQTYESKSESESSVDEPELALTAPRVKKKRAIKPHQCEICGAIFTRKTYLLDHKEGHFPDRKYTCTFCKKTFRRRTAFTQHKRLHTRPGEFVCEFCGRVFNGKGTLKTHILLIHVKERKYKCSLCNDTFSLRSSMQKHLLRHQTRNKEFLCAHCPAGYKDKSSLNRHVYLKHSKDNTKVQCYECGKEYATNSSMRKHWRALHSDKPDNFKSIFETSTNKDEKQDFNVVPNLT